MEPAFVCEFKLTIPMIAARFRKYHPIRWVVMMLIGIGYFLYMLPSVIYYGFDMFWSVMFLFGVGYLLYGIFLPQVSARIVLRRFEKDTAGNGIYRISFGDTIEVQEGNIQVTWNYSEINQVCALKHSFDLLKNKRLGLTVDPNGFTKGTFSEFKQFLREKRPDLNIPA